MRWVLGLVVVLLAQAVLAEETSAVSTRPDAGLQVQAAPLPAPSVSTDGGPEQERRLPETARVDGRSVRHEVETGSGMGRWAVWESTHWLVDEDGSRRVGLRLTGGGGVPSAYTAFIASNGGSPPTPAERAQLLTWAGHVELNPADPRDQIAQATRLPDAPASTSVGSLEEGEFLLVAGKRISLTARKSPLVEQRESWRKLRDKTPPFEVLNNEVGTCPCYLVFYGQRFVEKSVELPGPFVARITQARNSTFALGERVRHGEVRWIGTQYGTLKWIGSVRGIDWFYGSAPLQDDGGVLYAIDLRRRTIQPLAIVGVLLDEIRASEEGIFFGTAEGRGAQVVMSRIEELLRKRSDWVVKTEKTEREPD